MSRTHLVVEGSAVHVASQSRLDGEVRRELMPDPPAPPPAPELPRDKTLPRAATPALAALGVEYRAALARRAAGVQAPAFPP